MEADTRGIAVQPKYQSQSYLCGVSSLLILPTHPVTPASTVLLEVERQELACGRIQRRDPGGGLSPWPLPFDARGETATL